MTLVLHAAYFMDVVTLVHAYHASLITWDLHDSYTKQTYRNRCNIAAANGVLALNIPIIHTKQDQSVPFKNICIDHRQPWVQNHLKSIKSAYSSSPFYDFYEDELLELYERVPDKLQDWNLLTSQYLLKRLHITGTQTYSETYLNDYTAKQLITTKQKPILQIAPYMQVFQEKYGFIQPLSGLDLLFNEGPSAGVYLKNQKEKLQ